MRYLWLVAVVSGAVWAVEPLSNGGFEQLGPDQVPDSWAYVGQQVSLAPEAHGGQVALKFVRVAGEAGETGVNSLPRLSLTGGVTAWFKVLACDQAEIQLSVIPLGADGSESTGLLRTTVITSPLHATDKQWHQARIPYDFAGQDKVKAALFALRVLGGTATVLLDDVAAVEYREAATMFKVADDFGNWLPPNDLTEVKLADGVFQAKTTGADPFLARPGLAVPATLAKKLIVRLRVGAGGGGGQLFWIRSDDATWDEAKSVNFPVTSDGEWHEVEIPLASSALWRGTITGLRLDPTATQANVPVAVDWLRLD